MFYTVWTSEKNKQQLFYTSFLPPPPRHHYFQCIFIGTEVQQKIIYKLYDVIILSDVITHVLYVTERQNSIWRSWNHCDCAVMEAVNPWPYRQWLSMLV